MNMHWSTDVASWVTVAAACGFLGMGLVALWQPARMMRYFGVAATTADLRNEIRAVYGGFGVAIAAVLIVTASSAALGPGVRLTVAVALLGMAAGRVVGFLCERAGGWPWLFGAIEVAVGAGLLASVA